MAKKIRVALLLFVILTALTVTASALEPDYRYVRICVNEGEITAYKSASQTVGEFLREKKITLGKNDIIVPSVDSEITNGLIIDLSTAFDIIVKIDGKDRIVNYPVARVAEIVGKLERETGLALKYDNDIWAEDTYEGMVIELSTFKTEEYETRTPIDFETETVNNDEVNEGVINVLVEGVPGERRILTKVDYLAGVEVDRTVVLDEISIPCINKVLELGTAPVVEVAKEDENVLQYEKVLEMTATAYTCDYQSTGKRPGDRGFGITASGMEARVGVVAVDPRVIPLGTELFIEGYGYAIAGDTGSAIKGNKIDLYFNTTKECMQFGRRPITVYVLSSEK